MTKTETKSGQEREGSTPPGGKPGEASVWQGLPTESRNPRSEDLDLLSPEDAVGLLLEEDRRGLDAALAQRTLIATAADWLAETMGLGRDLVLVGAGTSGRLAVLEAAECPPTFGTDPRRIRAVIAGGEEAVFRAREGAEDREDEGRAAMAGLNRLDLVIAVSASSVTPFARGALAAAREKLARTVLLTCAGRDGLEDVAHLLIALATGPEVLTGSTRLKAGSATKAVLNAITTTAMVRLGKVYGNLMVDLRPGSAKLQDRARRIVETAGEVPPEDASRLLAEAEGEVKTAIVMARLGLSAAAARERLLDSAGHVRLALAEKS